MRTRYTNLGNPSWAYEVAYEYKIGTDKEIHPHAFHLLVDSIVRRVEMVVTKRDRSVANLRARGGQDPVGAESIVVKMEDSNMVRIVFNSGSSEEREEFVQAVKRSLADMGIEAKSSD